MFHYWATGRLPNDDRRLAAIACMSGYEWKKFRPILKRFFKNNWRHPRIEADLAAAQKSYEKRANAGEKGGNAKAAAKQSSSNATAKLEQPFTFNPTNPTNPTEEAKNASSVVRLAAKRGSPLADNWQPSFNDLKDAGEIGLRLYQIDNEIHKFRDYWHARAGPGAVKRDWSATWRNWCRKAIEGKGNGSRPSVMEAGERLIAAEKARTGVDTGPLLDLTPTSSTTSDQASGPLPER
jgi:uncharacterized protein YdaU (DUF1376 family)